jgi:transposase
LSKSGETSLGDGELYTIVTNKAAKGRNGTIVAIVAGTASEHIIEVLERLPEELLGRVEEVRLDMADSMRKIVRRCFPKAIRVIDRFHVQKLAHDALQEMRIAHCWDAINQETEAKEQAKSPQTNVICESFNRKVQNEFYAIAFRKKIYQFIEQLPTDIDEWMDNYNLNRTHYGKYCFGKNSNGNIYHFHQSCKG